MVWATALIPSLPGTQKSTTVLERVPEIQGTNRTTRTDLCSPPRIHTHFLFRQRCTVCRVCISICESYTSSHTRRFQPADDSREGNIAWMAMRESRNVVARAQRSFISGRVSRLHSKPQHTTSTRKSSSVAYQTRL